MPKDNNIIHAHTRGYAKRAALSAALFVYTCYPMKERVGFPIAIYIGSPKKSVTFLGERRHKSPNVAKRHSLRPCCRTRDFAHFLMSARSTRVL